MHLSLVMVIEFFEIRNLKCCAQMLENIINIDCGCFDS